MANWACNRCCNTSHSRLQANTGNTNVHGHLNITTFISKVLKIDLTWAGERANEFNSLAPGTYSSNVKLEIVKLISRIQGYR